MQGVHRLAVEIVDEQHGHGAAAGRVLERIEALVELGVLALVLVVHATRNHTMTGTNTMITQAPCVNLVIAITTVTTAVVTAPRPLIAQAVPPSRLPELRWCLAMPACESVNEVNTPIAYSGISRCDVGPDRIDEHRRGDGEEDDAVREHEAVAALGELAGA